MEIRLLAELIVFCGAINLIRMAIFLIGSDIYSLKAHKKLKLQKVYTPDISVVIPAHNEEGNIIRCINSVILSDYPSKNIDVIVVDDGSTDNTPTIVQKFIKNHRHYNIKLVRQENSGKARALNNGMKNYAKSGLIMCLDSDSYLGKNALRNAVQYFQNPATAALSSNIRILPGPGLLNLVQRFEYLVSYQMKRAESLFNIEYIVGGIGSVFRKSVLEKVGYYDTNTVTEDIDLTMKILQLGNKKFKVEYGADVQTYTESVFSISGLIKQRERWKWGRCQTFLKNKNMFLTRDEKFTRGLTWFYLPLALYGDLAYLIEPILLTYILFNSIVFRDPYALISAWIVISSYVILNILSEDTLGYREKLWFLLGAPFMYGLFYILSFVEYVALIKSVVNIGKLKQSLLAGNQSWKHVERQAKVETRPFPTWLMAGAAIATVVLVIFSSALWVKASPTTLISPVPDTTVATSLPTPTPMQKHTVVQGESLWKIAKNYYGQGKDWQKLSVSGNPNHIEPGQEILIP